jgi:small ligand-binding sensory domain FIST
MPIKAGSGISVLRNGEEAAREAAQRALETARLRRPAVAFVFATTHHAAKFDKVVHAIAFSTGARTIAGCSGLGVLTDEREVERGPAVAVLLAGGNGLRVEAGLLPPGEAHDIGQAVGQLAAASARAAAAARGAEAAGGRAAARRVPAGAASATPHATRAPPLLLFPDLRALEPGPFFAGLEAAAGFIPVAGGAPAGEDGRVYQFGGGKVVAGRSGTAIIHAGARMEVGVAQACRPIGRPAVVTECEDRTIRKLARRPAAEALHHALEAAGLDTRRLPEVFAGIAIDPRKHPLVRGDFLVRRLVGVDAESGAIVIGEPVRVGQTIVFQARDRAAAEEDLRAMLDDLAARLGRKKPRFGLYFDCSGRGAELYGARDHDPAAIRARFPGVPFAGFKGIAEIAPIGRRNLLHAMTGTLALFCDA